VLHYVLVDGALHRIVAVSKLSQCLVLPKGVLIIATPKRLIEAIVCHFSVFSEAVV
jgi:hypothetical protein